VVLVVVLVVVVSVSVVVVLGVVVDGVVVVVAPGAKPHFLPLLLGFGFLW
jgi:hypothetical protein